MKYLFSLLIILCSCEPIAVDRPLLYKTKLQRVEALYNQNDETLKTLDRINDKADKLAKDVTELYRLVVELRYSYSPSCFCSEELTSP